MAAVKKMAALVKTEAAQGLTLTSVDIPEVGPGDVKIRIKKTAICGTDVHIYDWNEWAQATIKAPVTIGHEYCGEIVEVGANVQAFTVGERVSGEGHIVCGKCRSCMAGERHLCPNTVGVGVNRDGAFAEYLVIPQTNVWRCEDGISDELYAIFDPFGNATHTALSFNMVGEDVLVCGAGPIGIMAAAISRHVGARHVVLTDLNDYRLELAKKLCRLTTVNVQRESLRDTMAALGMKEGFDVALEMSGSAAGLRSTLGSMRHGGRIALLGIPSQEVAIDWNTVIFGGLFLKGIYGREMFETWYKMTAMLKSGLDISPIITHRFDVRDFEEGFAAMQSGRSGKVILDWENM